VVVTHLFVMALALSASALLLGIGADRLRRRGTPLAATLAVATGAAMLAQLALVLRWPVPVWLPWVTIAATGAGTVLSYAILSEMFPKSASGRANGALNLLHVTAAFVIQYAIGLGVQQWPAEDGHYPPEAYQAALGLNRAAQRGRGPAGGFDA
jgi:MFS family permease